MKNLDILQQQKAEILMKINQAVKDGDEAGFGQAFAEFTELLQEAVMSEANGLIQAADNTILAGRGVRALTSTETEYYQKLSNAMRSKNPKQALADIELTIPKTIIDSVFEDITEAHPLLDVINFQATGALVEIIVSDQDSRQMAAWGKLCDDIIKELSAGFKVLDLTQKKLSAFIPVCKAMLDLGPEWLDRYVRAHLSESIANGLEAGIIDGKGLDEPTGMRRNPEGSLDPVNGYPLLTLATLEQITPETYGNLIAGLVVGPTGLTRTITEVLLVVNPIDYFKKILPSTSYQQQTGTWVNNIFPFPTRVVQSVHVPENEAIIGLARRYFMALGTSKGGNVEYSDEYRFLEDERVYLTKLYGNGKPLDALSFKRLNITNLKPTPWKVQIENQPIEVTGWEDARLASLVVGSLTLSPAFNKSVFVYTANTTNATNTVTAVAKDAESEIEILNGVTPVANGASATWAAGDNIVTINVTNGAETETYTVTVKKS